MTGIDWRSLLSLPATGETILAERNDMQISLSLEGVLVRDRPKAPHTIMQLLPECLCYADVTRGEMCG